MEITVYNSLKGSLETITLAFTEENTTWFNEYEHDDDVYMITDFDEGILIKEWGYTYPILIDGSSRAAIAYDQQKAKELKDRRCP
jgi:hypothetical protein